MYKFPPELGCLGARGTNSHELNLKPGAALFMGYLS